MFMYIKTNQLFKSLLAVMLVASLAFTACNNEGEPAEPKDSTTAEPAPVTEPAPAAPDSTAKDTGMDSGDVKPVVPTQPK